MGTIFVSIIMIIIIGLAVNSMRVDKKNGTSIQCGRECKHCGGHCGSGQKHSV